jgi:hypothetical protein
MKTTTLLRFTCHLLVCLSLAGLAACGKRDAAPPPTETEKVIIPDADRLKPAPTVPAGVDVAPPADTGVTLPPTPITPAPETAMNNSPAKPAPLKVPAFAQQTAPAGLYLRFLATGESFYTEIRLANGILSYTYFEDDENRCAQWVKNTPCWQQSDLKTISMALPDEDLDNLYTLVKESGILKLQRDTFGGARQGQRHYAQKIEAGLDGKEKTITYQSFPGASKKPEAFARVETALLEYARDLPH